MKTDNEGCGLRSWAGKTLQGPPGLFSPYGLGGELGSAYSLAQSEELCRATMTQRLGVAKLWLRNHASIHLPALFFHFLLHITTVILLVLHKYTHRATTLPFASASRHTTLQHSPPSSTLTPV